MKISRSGFLFGVLVTVVIALLLWYGNRKRSESSPAVSVEANITSSAEAAADTNSPVSAVDQTNGPVSTAALSAALSKAPPPNKAERAIHLLAMYNDVPIDFYGKVEDQFSNVVANAAVNFSIRIYNGTESTVKRGQVMTDDNGFFSITGYKGQDLGLGPQKVGYVPTTSSSGTLFKYSRAEDHPYVPDPNNPVVFRMWKLQGAQPLVGIDKQYKLRYTTAPSILIWSPDKSCQAEVI